MGASASSPMIKQGITTMAMGLNTIWTGTGISSDCYGGVCGNCSITGQKDYFNVGEACYALVYFDNITTAVSVELRWINTSGGVVSTNNYSLGAPPSGCWKIASWWGSLPVSLVGNPRIEVYVNGSWAGTKYFVVTEQTKSVRIDAVIKNTGTRNLNLLVGYMIDSPPDWTRSSTFALAPGQQTTITFNTTATYGTHTLNTRLWLSDMTYMDNNTKTFTV